MVSWTIGPGCALRRFEMVFAIFCVLCALATLAWLAGGVMTLALPRSDAAGNGLGQVYALGAFAITWLLVAILLELACRALPVPFGGDMPWPWGPSGWGRWVALGLAAGAQVFGFAALFASSCRGVTRAVLQTGAVTLPLPFVVHAAWRGFGWPRFFPVATWGCLALLGIAGMGCVGEALAYRWTRRRARERSHHSPAPNEVLYPALLLWERQCVRVLRGADELLSAVSEVLSSAAPVLVDCHRGCFRVTLGEGKVALSRVRELSMQELHELLLLMPSLHTDPARDAEIRRLVAMQRDVSGLSFVLPRA
jgi:hypothetical protein